MKRRWIMVIALVVVLLLGGVLAGPIMSDVEQPEYQLLAEDGAIEIRRYQPMIIAEVSMTGERKNAIGDGFRVLADYIFGNNTTTDQINMTAPVAQQVSTKIAMTAPVQQTISDDQWKVSFVMPSDHSLQTLPRPNNDQVSLIEVPARTFAVIRFAGANDDDNVARHQDLLETYLAQNNLTPLGPANYAFYNPPWTLPALRRNEVMFEITGESVKG